MDGKGVVVGGLVSVGVGVGPVGVGGGIVAEAVNVGGTGVGVGVQASIIDWVNWATMVRADCVSCASEGVGVAVGVGSSGSDRQEVNTKTNSITRIRINFFFILFTLFDSPRCSALFKIAFN